MDEKRLFVCSIGPVQDFIATARTSHDLWFGSWMLSELAKAAAKVISEGPHQLIFPAPGQDLEPGSRVNVANKIVAIIESDPKMTAKQVHQAITQRLEQLYQDTFKRVKGRVNKELAQEQISGLVEFYWASVPYADAQDYKKARAKAEALLAARKNTRNFQQANGYEGNPKSSLDGFRESVLLDSPSYEDYRARQGEILSGIDLLKRWGEIEGRTFLSTTDLAAMPFLLMIGKEQERILLSRIKDLLAEYTTHPETDGTHFYVERLVQLISDKEDEFRDRFAEIFREEGIHQRPSPYYALLLADGDNMGKTIDAQDTLEKHQEISGKLSEFAFAASQLIENRSGVPIYVGGDDVLAYLPLHTALQCVFDLNAEFKQAMQGFSFSDDTGQHSPTLSGGLVIAHHLTPLSDVLDIARQAEKKAKGVPGKNTLSIVSSKRSGADRTASAKMLPLIERMQVLIKYVQQKQISTGTAYELQKLHQQLSDVELPELFQREAIRIIQRKREAGGGQSVEKEVLQQFQKWFKDENVCLDELAQEMIIAREFATAYDPAKKEA